MYFEITYPEVLIFISVIWIMVRIIFGIKNKKVSLERELVLLPVYICLIVIARFVYFPLGLVDGHIGVLRFDSDRIAPPWINLVPVVHMFDKYKGWLINIIGNIAMFIPVGIVWPICYKKIDSFLKTVLAGAGLTLIIEITQLLFYDRCSDIDDFIMNTTGTAIGAAIFFIAKAVVNNIKNHKNNK